MKTTIYDLWNVAEGDVRNRETRETQYQDLLHLLDQYHNTLEAGLTEEGKALLGRFEDCYGEKENIECEKAFAKGFVLGAELMIEVLMDE